MKQKINFVMLALGMFVSVVHAVKDPKQVKICLFFKTINAKYSERAYREQTFNAFTVRLAAYEETKQFAKQLADLRKKEQVSDDDIITALSHWKGASSVQDALSYFCELAQDYIVVKNCKFCCIPFIFSKLFCCCGVEWVTDVHVKRLEDLKCLLVKKQQLRTN